MPTLKYICTYKVVLYSVCSSYVEYKKESFVAAVRTPINYRYNCMLFIIVLEHVLLTEQLFILSCVVWSALAVLAVCCSCQYRVC